MANKFRGEYTVTLDGLDITLKASFQNIQRLESRLGMGVFKYATALANTNFEVSTTATVLWCLSHKPDGKPQYKLEEIGEALVNDMDELLPVNIVLINLITGKDPDGEAEEETVEEDTTEKKVKTNTSPSRKPSNKRQPT